MRRQKLQSYFTYGRNNVFVDLHTFHDILSLVFASAIILIFKISKTFSSLDLVPFSETSSDSLTWIEAEMYWNCMKRADLL